TVGDGPPGVELKINETLDEFAIAFIERSPFLVLSTSNKDGLLDASPKGDGPGFVLVESDRSLVIPDRPGNGLAMGHLNVLENPRVGLLFLIPGTNETLRVNGCAELTRNPALLERLAARGKPAVLAIRVEIEECFFHCGKAFIRSNLWQPEQWGERHRVSFGNMIAKKIEADESVARKIDESIEEDYRTGL
ncbi:MAG: pyridoxamine 5'-phosphate oxidase family protein, partial [Deltaproteobacteria bacterium]|nr:pyridoxamine 5'-phosphate oxidase family protein [Deltaproteobacteria bacterium]